MIRVATFRRMGCVFSRANDGPVAPVDSSDYGALPSSDTPDPYSVPPPTPSRAERPRLTVDYANCEWCNLYAEADSFFILATTQGSMRVCSRSCKMTLVKRRRLIECGITPPRTEGRTWFS